MSQLVRQHDDLAAMMRLMGEHVTEHGGAGGPDRNPAPAREFGHEASRVRGQSVGEHAQTLSSAFLVRGDCLLDGATAGVERRRTLQVRSGMFDPHQAAVVQVGKDGGEGAAASLLSGRLRTPGAPVEMREQELVHGIVDGVDFKENVTQVGRRKLRHGITQGFVRFYAGSNGIEKMG